MSIPKHDPSLAKFLTTLDPSLYTISGGAEPTPPTAKAVENLKEQQEYQFYQNTLTADSLPTSTKKSHKSVPPCNLNQEIAFSNRIIANQMRYSRPQGSTFGGVVFAFILGGACVLVAIKVLS